MIGLVELVFPHPERSCSVSESGGRESDGRKITNIATHRGVGARRLSGISRVELSDLYAITTTNFNPWRRTTNCSCTEGCAPGFSRAARAAAAVDRYREFARAKTGWEKRRERVGRVVERRRGRWNPRGGAEREYSVVILPRSRPRMTQIFPVHANL